MNHLGGFGIDWFYELSVVPIGYSLVDCHPGTKGPMFSLSDELLVQPLVIWVLARWIKLCGLLPA